MKKTVDVEQKIQIQHMLDKIFCFYGKPIGFFCHLKVTNIRNRRQIQEIKILINEKSNSLNTDLD